MGVWFDALCLVTILVEVAVLFYWEYKTWQSLYTPLNFLMLPYIVVLLITILLAGGEMGFVEFCYPSIFIWNVGLLLFAIPSFLLGGLLHYKSRPVVATAMSDELPKTLTFMMIVMALLFLWHLKGSITNSAEALGSDEFGEEFSGGGLWGHLRVLTLPLLMMSIYYVSKKRWWLWPVIIVFLLVSVLNQVKGWVIIPVLAAMAMRVYAGKTRLTVKLLSYMVLGAFSVFFLSYALSILVVQERGVSDEFVDFIFTHFFHYLTSGTYGWSMDVERGIPDDTGNFQNVLAQLVNIYKMIVGEDDLVYPVNPLYYNSGNTLTNVRTIFGTLYINSSWLGFALFTFFLSFSMYLMKLATMRFNNIYTYTIYFFFCGLIFMGWFDFYFSGIMVLEFPIIVLLLCLFENIVYKEKEKVEVKEL